MHSAKRSTKRRPGRPPGSTRDATRARILSAARASFAARGFAVTTNRDIAERAGVTAGAIYQYFDSKLALYAAAAREAVIEIAAHMRVHIGTDPSTAIALREIVLSLLAMQDRDPSLPPFFAAMHFEAQRNPAIGQAIKRDREEIVSVMVEVAQSGVRSGDIDAKDVPRVVSMFIACTVGLSQFATALGPERLAEATTAYAALLDGTLFRRPRARPKPKAKPERVRGTRRRS